MLQHDHDSADVSLKMVETTSSYDRKRNGEALGKLRVIQLIEANLQLITRFFVDIRNKGNMESEERLSKSNYGSRPGNST